MGEKWLSRRDVVGAALLLGAGGVLPAGAAEGSGTPLLSDDEMAAVDAALGKKGTRSRTRPSTRVPLPRNDLKITLKGDPVPIPFGFGGWVSFKKTRDGQTHCPDERHRAPSGGSERRHLRRAGERGGDHGDPQPLLLRGAAHLLHARPCHGRARGAGAGLRRAIRADKLFPANQPPPGPPPARTGKEIFDLPALDRITGTTGTVNGPTYKYTVGRSDLTVMAMGAVITAAIGLNSWAAFAG